MKTCYIIGNIELSKAGITWVKKYITQENDSTISHIPILVRLKNSDLESLWPVEANQQGPYEDIS